MNYKDCVTDEDFRLCKLTKEEPWRIEGIRVEHWIAERPELLSLEVPRPTARWQRYGDTAGWPPQNPGVYFLFDASGQLLYVGMSSNIEARICGHWRKEEIPFWGVSWRILPTKAATVLEAYLIDRMDPPYNVKFCCNMAQWSEDLARAMGEASNPPRRIMLSL